MVETQEQKLNAVIDLMAVKYPNATIEEFVGGTPYGEDIMWSLEVWENDKVIDEFYCFYPKYDSNIYDGPNEVKFIMGV